MKDSNNNITEIVHGYKFVTGEIERTVLYIYSKTNHFVVFELKETGQISYKTTTDFDDDTNEIALKLDKVETYLGEDKEKWNAYKNTMADIYSLYLSKDKEHQATAKSLLNRVLSEINYNMFSKLYYLLPCLLVVLFAGGFAILTGPSMSTGWYTIAPDFQQIAYMMTFGSIGGLLSIAIYIDKHEDKNIRIRWPRALAGIFRILIAMLSGLIMYILLEAKIIGGIQDFEANRYMYYALAILAGFSQNLIPDLASKGESLLIGKDEEKTK